jgi:hypothetical protein
VVETIAGMELGTAILLQTSLGQLRVVTQLLSVVLLYFDSAVSRERRFLYLQQNRGVKSMSRFIASFPHCASADFLTGYKITIQEGCRRSSLVASPQPEDLHGAEQNSYCGKPACGNLECVRGDF